MKKILTLLFALLSTIGMKADVLAELTFPGSNDKGVSSYTASWTATNDYGTWSISGFNNNNNASTWTYIKCGWKTAASNSTITTPAIEGAITDLVVVVDKTSGVESAKLKVIKDGLTVNTINCTSKWEAGSVKINVTAESGSVLELVLENEKVSSNGTTQISKITVNGTPDTAGGDPVAVESVSLTDDKGNALSSNILLKTSESLTLKAVVAPSNATNKKVTWEVMQNSDVISFDEESGLVKALAPGQAAVVATTEDGEKQAAVTFYVSNPEKSTIAEFIANEGGACYLTGVVSNIKNTTYGNFDLTDETGTIYVYGCLTPAGEKQQFESLGISEGDKITVFASEYQLYKETKEAVNVVFVENHGSVPTYTFDVVAGTETFTVTPSDNNVQYYIEVLPAGYDIEAVTEYFDGMFDEMGAGLEYFSGVQTQSYADDWYMDEPGDYVIYICAVNGDYERASDVKAVEFTLEAPVVPVEVALTNIQIMDEPNPFTGDPAIWWQGLDEEDNEYILLFDTDYNFITGIIGEELYSDEEYENNVIVNKTASSISLDATIKFTDGDEIEQVYHITANIATATMAISDAKYATFVAPFDAEIPEGVQAYTVDAVENDVLTMTEVTTTIPANTPVVLYAEEGACSITVTGTAVEGTPVAGLLTGVYTETTAPAGAYVLQKQDKVGFYKVASNNIKVSANRAYLTVPSSVKAFYFDEATAIEAVEALMAGKAEIYDLNGRKMQSLQKGMNIVNGKKVMVK